ncbi:MAG: sulfatase-like hydrolase/transferase [Candidatus Helarchaeota archaeon]|nr:sulfatase-like hydrolase/transferase [Candidatus Helarchaeota archaeon]
MIKISEKLNVLFIITDQQRADHLGCAGNPVLKTPNLDALAKDGVRFTRFYCSNPMCMPNRATLFTGLYPSLHGVRCNGINLNTGIPTFTQTLHNAGYHTASMGKIHLSWSAPGYSRKNKSPECSNDWLYKPKSKRPKIPIPYYGLDEVELVIAHGDAVSGHYLDWLEEKTKGTGIVEALKARSLRAFEKIYYDTPLTKDLYQTTYVTERTIAFLKRFSEDKYGDKPFFMHCSYPDPHHPVCPPAPYRDMYKPEKINLPPAFNESLEDHEMLGPALKNPVISRLVLRKSTEEEIRKFLAYSYGSISMIDHGVGQILASLKSLGLENNTMVIFTSDHGDLGGDYKLLLKGPAHYQGILNIPLIWKLPGVTKKGTVTDSLASTIDISTTILSLLNIDKKLYPPEMQGHDLTPILKDPEAKVRDHVIIEEDEELPMMKKGRDTNIRLRTLITETHRITISQGYEDFGEIIDLINDPNEVNNLWYDDNSKELRFKLLNKLTQELLNLQSRLPKKQALT